MLFLFFLFSLITADLSAKEHDWKNRVYLATYPRSGNHWVRYLIEEATGIATSSVYQDHVPEHLPTIFRWGGYCADHGYEGLSSYPENGQIAIVKTHFPASSATPFDKLPYVRSIRIIRHPIDCFYSLYLYKQNYPFKPYYFLIPRKFLYKYIKSWSRFQKYWDAQKNVVTIRYEDLHRDPILHLGIILKRLGYSVSSEDIQRAVTKYPPRGHLLKHLEHFTKEDLSIMESHLGSLMRQYGYTIPTL